MRCPPRKELVPGTQFRRERRRPTPVQAQGGGDARAVLPRGQKRAKCLEVSFGLEGNSSPRTRFVLHSYGLEVQTGKRLQPQIELLGELGKTLTATNLYMQFF